MTIVATRQERPQISVSHPEGAKHQLLLFHGLSPLRRRSFADMRPAQLPQQHLMNFRQAVVSRDRKNRAADRVGGLHVGSFFGVMVVIRETFVQSLDVDEFLVYDPGTGKLAREAFERADNWNDLIDLGVRHCPGNGTAVCERSQAGFSREQFERLANGTARDPEAST